MNRRLRLLAAFAVVASAATALALIQPWTGPPHLTRSQAIDIALEGYQANRFSRIEAKLVSFDDLGRVPDFNGIQANTTASRAWVVAISGNYGISPSFGCCSVPSDYAGKNTWGAAIIPDRAGPAKVLVYATDWHGKWPPWFDGLHDLAS